MDDDRFGQLLKKYPFLADAVKNHPLGDLKDYPRDLVLSTQASMLEGASHFLESQREHLCVVIRLTIEFSHFLQRVDIDSVDFDFLLYIDGSTFGGVRSFCSVCQAYRVTQGETRSTLPQRVTSRVALKDQFINMYREFAAETNFEKKCRLLLDLFKLQIIFAGMTYD